MYYQSKVLSIEVLDQEKTWSLIYCTSLITSLFWQVAFEFSVMAVKTTKCHQYWFKLWSLFTLGVFILFIIFDDVIDSAGRLWTDKHHGCNDKLCTDRDEPWGPETSALWHHSCQHRPHLCGGGGMNHSNE